MALVARRRTVRAMRAGSHRAADQDRGGVGGGGADCSWRYISSSQSATGCGSGRRRSTILPQISPAPRRGFHNSRSGCCFPSYEAIAAKAECARSTVAEAIKALEWAGVLTWQNRITRILARERDLFGQWASRWRVIRTSNAYVFRDPLQGSGSRPASKSENPSGTGNQDVFDLVPAPAPDPNSPLQRALTRLGAALGIKDGIEQGSGPVGAAKGVA